LRGLSTRELLKLFQVIVDDQMERIDDMDLVLHGDLSTKGMVHMRYYAMVVLYFIFFLLRIALLIFYPLGYIIDDRLLMEIHIIDFLFLLLHLGLQ
jgi:hypothetical protein